MSYLNDFDIPKALGIDRVRAGRLAEAYEGYALLSSPKEFPVSGNIYSRNSPAGAAESAPGMRWPASVAAGYLARAASYWSMLNPQRSTSCYRKAAELTFKNVHSLGLIDDFSPAPGELLRAMPLELLGAVRIEEVERRFSDAVENVGPLPSPEVARVILSAASSIALQSRHSGLIHQTIDRLGPGYLERFRAIPVGRLRLPLSFYWRFANISLAGEGVSNEMIDWLRSFAARLDERISLAQASRYHWERLYSALLPIEPEALIPLYSFQLGFEAFENADVVGISHNFPTTFQAYAAAALQLGRQSSL